MWNSRRKVKKEIEDYKHYKEDEVDERYVLKKSKYVNGVLKGVFYNGNPSFSKDVVKMTYSIALKRFWNKGDLNADYCESLDICKIGFTDNSIFFLYEKILFSEIPEEVLSKMRKTFMNKKNES